MELEKSLTDYYGKHKSPYVQKLTMDYIRNNYDRRNHSDLVQAILKSHPYSWGFPDVSAIETAATRFEVSDKKSLRKKKEFTDYNSSPISDLTEEERVEAEPCRGPWKQMLEKITSRVTDKLDPETMKDVKRELEK